MGLTDFQTRCLKATCCVYHSFLHPPLPASSCDAINNLQGHHSVFIRYTKATCCGASSPGPWSRPFLTSTLGRSASSLTLTPFRRTKGFRWLTLLVRFYFNPTFEFILSRSTSKLAKHKPMIWMHVEMWTKDWEWLHSHQSVRACKHCFDCESLCKYHSIFPYLCLHILIPPTAGLTGHNDVYLWSVPTPTFMVLYSCTTELPLNRTGRFPSLSVCVSCQFSTKNVVLFSLVHLYCEESCHQLWGYQYCSKCPL